MRGNWKCSLQKFGRFLSKYQCGGGARSTNRKESFYQRSTWGNGNKRVLFRNVLKEYYAKTLRKCYSETFQKKY